MTVFVAIGITLVLINSGHGQSTNIQSTPEEQFDPSYQVCCCGKLHGSQRKPFPQERFRCCGQEAYDPEKSTCCQGVLNHRKPETTFKCCHKTAYNPENQACFTNGSLSRLPGRQKQCGDVIYKQTDFTCCSGRLRERRGPKTACCGTQTYHVTEEMCCNGVVRARLATFHQVPAQCCGTEAYDVASQVCCVENGVSVLKERPLGRTYRDVSFAQCGATVYAPRAQSCCCGEISGGDTLRQRDSCCGRVPYNTRTHICCEGVLHEKNGLFRLCCGQQVFDHRFENCCEVGNELVVMKGTKVDSCLPRQVDPFPQVFCRQFDVSALEGQLWMDGATIRCCGAAAYDTGRESCCLPAACAILGVGDKACQVHVVNRQDSTPGQVCTST